MLGWVGIAIADRRAPHHGVSPAPAQGRSRRSEEMGAPAQALGEPTIADAIMDRLLDNAHRIELRVVPRNDQGIASADEVARRIKTYVPDMQIDIRIVDRVPLFSAGTR